MISVKEVAWLAGIVEGEGCFQFNRNTPSIKVVMTDKDIIERVCSLFQCNLVYGGKRGNHKPIFIAHVSSYKAAQWMMTILPFMGERRFDKIKNVLQLWKTRRSIGTPYTFGCGHERIGNTRGLGISRRCRICQNAYARRKRAEAKNM